MQRQSVRVCTVVAFLCWVSCEGPDILGVHVGEQWLHASDSLILCEGVEQTLSVEFLANATLGPGAILPFELQTFVEVSPAVGEVTALSYGLQEIHEVHLAGQTKGAFELQLYARGRRSDDRVVKIDRTISVNVVPCAPGSEPAPDA